MDFTGSQTFLNFVSFRRHAEIVSQNLVHITSDGVNISNVSPIAVMDLMEPLPLGLSWQEFCDIADGRVKYIDGDRENDIKKVFKTLASVLHGKIVSIDGMIYPHDHVFPAEYKRYGQFVYTDAMIPKFLGIMGNYKVTEDGEPVPTVLVPIREKNAAFLDKLSGTSTKPLEDSVVLEAHDAPAPRTMHPLSKSYSLRDQDKSVIFGNIDAEATYIDPDADVDDKVPDILGGFVTKADPSKDWAAEEDIIEKVNAAIEKLDIGDARDMMTDEEWRGIDFDSEQEKKEIAEAAVEELMRDTGLKRTSKDGDLATSQDKKRSGDGLTPRDAKKANQDPDTATITKVNNGLADKREEHQKKFPPRKNGEWYVIDETATLVIAMTDKDMEKKVKNFKYKDCNVCVASDDPELFLELITQLYGTSERLFRTNKTTLTPKQVESFLNDPNGNIDELPEMEAAQIYTTRCAQFETPSDWQLNNPILHPDFVDIAKSDKKFVQECKSLAKLVTNGFGVIMKENTFTLVHLGDKRLKAQGGRFYDEYGVWFSKSERKLVEYIFEMQDKIETHDQALLKDLKDRPTWKWLDLDTLEYIDKRKHYFNEYMVTSDHAILPFSKMIQAKCKPFPVPTYRGTIHIKIPDSVLTAMLNTPVGAYYDLGSKKYTKTPKSAYVDKDYRWCTADEKVIAKKEQIRYLLYNKFMTM